MMKNKIVASLIVSLSLFTSGINATLRSDDKMIGHRSRELWGYGGQWSFTNLLFHLGVCTADPNCADKPHPPGPLGPLCGCPDCTKPHPPHFQDNYCENLASSSNSTTTEQDSEAAVQSSTKEASSSGATQTASSIFNPFALMAAAAVMAFIIAGIIMQKRRQQEVDERALPLDGAKDSSSVAGMSTTFAALMTKMGLKAGENPDTDNYYDDIDDDASVHSVKNAVLTRQSLVNRGVAVPPVYSTESTPSFIPIPKDHTNPYVSQTVEGLEVGGYNPSGVRQISDYHSSTPYAV